MKNAAGRRKQFVENLAAELVRVPADLVIDLDLIGVSEHFLDF